jgi:transcriptional regulator PpsR
VKSFKSPRKFFAELDADAVASMATAAADVTLIVDQAGIIRDCAFNNDELARDLDGAGRWRGRPWAETVTPDSRAKVETILREAASGAAPRWRHVNHPVPPGTPPAPVHYCAVQVDAYGRYVVFGRDLRPVSALQQQLIEAQQSMERDYARLRHIETRYRLLFQMSAEPVLIVDVGSQRIAECNPAAERQLRLTGGRVVGRPLVEAFARGTWRTVQNLLTNVKANGRPGMTHVTLPGSEGLATLSVSLFRQDDSAMFLVRLSLETSEIGGGAGPSLASPVLRLMENAPDGFVVTDADGLVQMANEAFLGMAELANQEQARGQSIERWLGRSGVDLSILISNLRQRSTVRLFATTLRNEYGATADVEISGVSVSIGDTPYLGFLVRGIQRRLKSGSATIVDMPRSVEQLTELVGRVSLKQLVRETTDLIEKLSIEAALRLTDDNRASAAELLGLSRQSLYVKLRRYGLADGPPQPGDTD